MRRRGTARTGPAVTRCLPGPLGRVEQLVLRGDGLTTTSLEILTGRVITVRVRAHWRLPLHADLHAMAPGDEVYTGLDAPDLSWFAAVGADQLDARPGDDLLVREVLLTGDDGVDYGAASLVAALDRLPAPVAHRLATTDEPIGRMLARNQVPVTRELRHWGLRRVGARGATLGADLAADAPVPARTYRMRLVRTGRPLALITEWFAPRVFAERGAVR
ncbi:chorismate--pyruvate lyase family protein [Polymorphospora lycopeni]|uniref:Chorismate pyruvate-lyase family protein n=1 Tax=Polymorphospora lycopeni TaxID=3140240 RepID=A0ABV5CT60_9ACTN